MTWSFSRNTLLLVGGMTATSFAYGFTMPNYPLYVEILGANSSEFGLLVFLKIATLVTVMIPGGWFSDNFGPKFALLVAGFADCGSFLILSIATSWHLIGIYSVLSGAAWGLATGAWYVILANENLTPDGMPNISAFSVGVLSHLLPDAVGALLGIGYFKLFGDVYTRPILSMTYKFGTVCSLLALGFYVFIRNPKYIERGGEVGRDTGSFSELFTKTNVGFLGFLSANFFLGLGTGMVFDFFPLYFVILFQVPPSLNNLLRFLSSVLMAGTSLTAPGIAKKLGKVTTVCLTQSLLIPPMLFLALERKSLLLAMIAFIARGVFLGIAWPVFSSMTMSILEEKNRGKGGSLWDLCWSGGYLITPPVSGRWIQAQGFAPSFNLTAVFYALSTLTFYFAVKQSLSSQNVKPSQMISGAKDWLSLQDKH
ncbi:MAG: MFS transporter [Candidatus Heimdallarchaeota archaeon]